MGKKQVKKDGPFYQLKQKRQDELVMALSDAWGAGENLCERFLERLDEDELKQYSAALDLLIIR